MDITHISIDTENWGKRAGCDGRSIGAVVFNPFKPLDLVNRMTAQELLAQGLAFYLALDNPLTPYSARDGGDGFNQHQLDRLHGEHRRYHLTRDESTVDWWHAPEQAEAAKAFDNPVELREALIQFTAWLQALGVDPERDNMRFWSHGAAYDPPIVEAWYHAVKLPVPWFYRAPRDTRTAFDLAQIDNHSKWLGQFQSGVKHNSLDDSWTQARGVGGAIEKSRRIV